MPDVFTQAKRSEVMSRIRSRGNKATELALVTLFRRHKISGWRRQVEVRIPKAEGRKPKMNKPGRSRGTTDFKVRADFVFPKLKLAVFVDGCFWHACPQHATTPKNNASFWQTKLAANKARDRQVNRKLREAGWRVLRIWEHALSRKNESRLAMRVKRFLEAGI